MLEPWAHEDPVFTQRNPEVKTFFNWTEKNTVKSNFILFYQTLQPQDVLNQALVEIGLDDSANLEQLGGARLVCIVIESIKQT